MEQAANLVQIHPTTCYFCLGSDESPAAEDSAKKMNLITERIAGGEKVYVDSKQHIGNMVTLTPCGHTVDDKCWNAYINFLKPEQKPSCGLCKSTVSTELLPDPLPIPIKERIEYAFQEKYNSIMQKPELMENTFVFGSAIASLSQILLATYQDPHSNQLQFTIAPIVALALPSLFIAGKIGKRLETVTPLRRVLAGVAGGLTAVKVTAQQGPKQLTSLIIGK